MDRRMAGQPKLENHKALHFLQIVQCQLNFMMSFVNDLLDLRQHRDNVFRLVEERFDPNATFTDLISIFKPQTDLRGLHISWSVDKTLKVD